MHKTSSYSRGFVPNSLAAAENWLPAPLFTVQSMLSLVVISQGIREMLCEQCDQTYVFFFGINNCNILQWTHFFALCLSDSVKMNLDRQKKKTLVQWVFMASS